MFSFPSKKKSGRERSASEVRKEYDSRIETFLRQVEGPKLNPFRRRDDPLDSLLEWGENIALEKQRVDDQLAKQIKQYKIAESHIQRLDRTLESTEDKLRKVTTENRNMSQMHSDEVMRITELHSKNSDQDRRKHEHETGVLRTKHNAEIVSWNMKYDRDMDSEREKQESQRRKNQSDLETLKADHSAEVTKLVGQLLVNQREDQGWPDGKLKIKFVELQRMIEAVTAPSNKEFLIPPNTQLGKHLDPTNFIGRVGRGKSHFFLKSAIWSVIVEQFFSVPFGFGALGPGNSKEELMKVYYAWRKLLEDHTSQLPKSSDHEAFASFYKDEMANNWRSATFQCINARLTSDDNIPRPDGLLARLSANNCDQTISRILGILSEVSNLSKGRVRVETEYEVQQMVNLGSTIALQFGVHPAQLRLLSPNRGEEIQIGESYHDCEDGDSYKGSVYGVDLVTAPGLQKIGDGRSDMSSSRIVAPCEIYPDQPTS